MNRDELIALTKEAGCCLESETLPVSDDFLERFANLVAAKEREECAKVCEETSDSGFIFSAEIRARKP